MRRVYDWVPVTSAELSLKSDRGGGGGFISADGSVASKFTIAMLSVMG